MALLCVFWHLCRGEMLGKKVLTAVFHADGCSMLKNSDHSQPGGVAQEFSQSALLGPHTTSAIALESTNRILVSA